MRDAEAGLARRLSTVLQICTTRHICGDILKNGGTDNFLYMSHEIFKSYEPNLSLQVCEFAKMSSSVAIKKKPR